MINNYDLTNVHFNLKDGSIILFSKISQALINYKLNTTDWSVASNKWKYAISGMFVRWQRNFMYSNFIIKRAKLLFFHDHKVI